MHQRQTEFLRRYKIVQSPTCPRCNALLCGIPLLSHRDRVRNEHSYRWSCVSDDCDVNLSFSFGSYLIHHRKPVFKHIQLLYKFHLARNATEAAKETGFSPGNAQKWFGFYRRCISHYMHYFYPIFEFDVNGALQWDEAASSTKQKHHRGKRREPVWVLGGVYDQSGFSVLGVVPE